MNGRECVLVAVGGAGPWACWWRGGVCCVQCVPSGLLCGWSVWWSVGGAVVHAVCQQHHCRASIEILSSDLTLLFTAQYCTISDLLDFSLSTFQLSKKSTTPTNQKTDQPTANQPTASKTAQHQPTSPHHLPSLHSQTHHWLFGVHQLTDPQPKLVNVRSQLSFSSTPLAHIVLGRSVPSAIILTW
jgi:hypothetical protein